MYVSAVLAPSLRAPSCRLPPPPHPQKAVVSQPRPGSLWLSTNTIQSSLSHTFPQTHQVVHARAPASPNREPSLQQFPPALLYAQDGRYSLQALQYQLLQNSRFSPPPPEKRPFAAVSGGRTGSAAQDWVPRPADFTPRRAYFNPPAKPIKKERKSDSSRAFEKITHLGKHWRVPPPNEGESRQISTKNEDGSKNQALEALLSLSVRVTRKPEARLTSGSPGRRVSPIFSLPGGVVTDELISRYVKLYIKVTTLKVRGISKRVHICVLCPGTAFSRRGHADVHLRAHCGAKPYACSWTNCNRRFGQVFYWYFVCLSYLSYPLHDICVSLEKPLQSSLQASSRITRTPMPNVQSHFRAEREPRHPHSNPPPVSTNLGVSLPKLSEEVQTEKRVEAPPLHVAPADFICRRPR